MPLPRRPKAGVKSRQEAWLRDPLKGSGTQQLREPCVEQAAASKGYEFDGLVQFIIFFH